MRLNIIASMSATGQDVQLSQLVVASTLVIAALFNPLRRGIQSFINRRSYRRKYDAGRTLESFALKLRDETDLEALREDQVVVVAIWLLCVALAVYLALRIF